MSDVRPRSQRKRRLLFLFAGMLLGAVGMCIYAGRLVLQRVPGGPAAVSFKQILATGEIRYTVPADLLQREMAAVFPLTQGMEGLLLFVLSDPRFVPDPDPAFLRVEVRLEAHIGGSSGEIHPGRAAVRTQVRFDLAKKAIVLTNCELTEFSFDGAAAPVAARFQPVLQAVIATGTRDYAVYTLPEVEGFWTRTGISLVRSVTIENHQVVVTAGL